MFRKPAFVVFLIVAILAASSLACSEAMPPAEIVLSPSDPNTIANGGSPVFIPPAACADPIGQGEFYDVELDGYPIDSTGRVAVAWCDPTATEGRKFDVLDATMIASLAIPGPADDIVVGTVWVAREGVPVMKFILVVAGAYAASNAAVYAARNWTPPAHSDPGHDPYVPGSTGNKILLWMVVNWAAITASPKPPRCGYWEVNGQPERFVWWVFSHMTGGYEAGRVVWAFAGGKFGGAYSGKLAQDLNIAPESLRNKPGMTVRWVSKPCGQMPSFGDFNPPAPLAP